MAYAIRVHGIVTHYKGKPRDCWMSVHGGVVSDINMAERWGRKESAELAAFTAIGRNPNFIGKLSIELIVVYRTTPNWRWVKPKGGKHGALLRTDPGKPRHGGPVRH